MGRKALTSWSNVRMLTDEHIHEVLTLKPGEEYIFSIEDFGDRSPADFRLALINYMRTVKKVKVSTRIVDGEVHVQLIDKDKASKIVAQEIVPEETVYDKDGFLIDKTGKPLLATVEELEAKRILDEKILAGG